MYYVIGGFPVYEGKMKNVIRKKHELAGYYFMALLTIILFVMLLPSVTCLLSKKGEVRAKVLAVDNDDVIASNVSSFGHQMLSVEIKDKPHKGEVVEATNILLGKLDTDTVYKKGDKLFVVFNPKPGPGSPAVRAVEQIRQGWVALLFGLFTLSLILFAGKVGLRALMSFIISLVIIIFVLIPALLNNFPPVLMTLVVVVLLSGIIIFSVAGFTRRGLSAFLGTLAGLGVTLIITQIFGYFMNLRGFTSPYSETLLFSGNLNLNIREVFYSSIVIGASGAAMDIAMDVATSMEEILLKKSDISRRELVLSGIKIGKAVIGTMTTTLLLAYSGSYLTLLMLFQTLNTGVVQILNMKIVAAELLRTLSGSLALVLVAPLTALAAGWLLKPVQKEWLPYEEMVENEEIRETELIQR
jgi:uncharacterized membrane protein